MCVDGPGMGFHMWVNDARISRRSAGGVPSGAGGGCKVAFWLVLVLSEMWAELESAGWDRE